MDLIIFKRTGDHQYHFGQNDLEDTFQHIQSDTLFSAIINCYAMLYSQAEVAGLIERFKEGRIQLSSGFPSLAAEGGYRVFFLPKPMTYHRVQGANVKRIKSIKFISAGLWRKGVSAQELLDQPILGGRFAMTEEERDQLGLPQAPVLLKRLKPLSSDLHPKVRVHARNQEDVFYHQAVVQLNELHPKGVAPIQTQFYSILDSQLTGDEDKRFKGALHLLGDEGVGGERSTGKGQIDEINILPGADGLFQPEQPVAKHCSISLTIPAGKAEFDLISQYDLTIRGGGSLGKYKSHERHRQQIRMIKEGAILQQPIKGKIEDLRPQVQNGGSDIPLPIYRYGHCFSLPFEARKTTT